ncbi:MAG: motif putative anchor domain protein [Gemmatimonadales bacterium]|nr:motif putative anchor domain protein [Gemmatimonadales bacterium]
MSVRLGLAVSALAIYGCSDVPTAPRGQAHASVVVKWDQAALAAIRRTHPGPPMVARALAVVHTAMYDAWAAYDGRAVGTRLGGTLRRPASERSNANKERAVSYAAYRTLLDLFPSEQASLDSLMNQLGFDQRDLSTDPATATGIGDLAAAAVLNFRHHDGANQLGDLSPGSYSDYTGYQPVNDPYTINDPNRWQPLLATDAQGVTTAQRFIAPHWGLVTPFALTSGAQFRPSAGPNLYPSAGYTDQALELMGFSANLTDEQKTIVEYWADGPGTELPSGHWALFAQWVAQRDSHGIDDDAKMFFALTNALLDASIAVWDCKRTFDYVRPITAVRFLMAGQQILAWGGPFRGPQLIRGEQWQAYQTGAVPTPAFPEFSSGHSAFSSAAAEVLRSFTGSDAFGDSATATAGSSRVEPGAVPATDITLSWATFSDAADQAGMSRRYGGIHFKEGDLQSRAMGRRVGAQAWAKAQGYFGGTAAP